MSDKSLLELRDRVGNIYERCLENTQEISSVFEVLCEICDKINDNKDDTTTTESKKKRSPRPPKRKTKLNNNTKASTTLSPQTPLPPDDETAADFDTLKRHQKKNKTILPAELFEFYERQKVPGTFELYAIRKGILSNHVSIYADFVLYHSKKNSKMANWYAAWQTWVRNQISFHPECLKPSGLAQSNYAKSPDDMEKILAN